MSKVPGSGRVDRALRGVKREVKGSLKEIHHQAAKLLERGNYAGSQALVNVANELRKFEARLEELASAWKALKGGSGGDSSSQRTPLWSYYKLILKALAADDGRVTTAQLLERLEPLVAAALKPKDLEMQSSGRLRWQAMVRQAKRPMTKEGFIEPDSGSVWRITTAGRRALADEGPK